MPPRFWPGSGGGPWGGASGAFELQRLGVEFDQRQDLSGSGALDEPAKQPGAEGEEDVGEVGEIAPGLVFGQAFVGAAGEGLGEVGGEDYGVDVLADGVMQGIQPCTFRVNANPLPAG